MSQRREQTGRGGKRAAWRRKFRRAAKSHYTNLAAGVLLMATGILELVDGVLLDLEERLEPHHALLVLGAVLVARSLADILEGLESLERASEE